MEAVEVLIDRPSGSISIVTSDDTSKVEVEHTLTVEQAWKLVTDLNQAIQKLSNPRKTILNPHRRGPGQNRKRKIA